MSAISNIGAKKWERTIHDILKKSYWVISLLILGFSSYFYYTGLNRPVAGVLWFVGGFLIFYYYWIKWFVLDQPLDPDFNTGSNACPDYLSVIPNNSGLYKPTSKSQYFCVDFVGVSRNGGIKRMNRNTVKTQIADPAFRFSVDPEVDFGTPTSRAAFLRRLQTAGLSYNSIGDSSLPTTGTYSNGAPAFGVGSVSTVVPPVPRSLVATTGSAGMSGASMPPMGGSLTITPALVSEMVSYAQAQNIQPPPTPAQAQAIANHLIFKNLAPPGTTGTQLSAAMESQPDMNAPENQNLRDKAQSDNFIKDSKKDPKGQLFVDSTTGLAIGFIESNGEGGCYSSTYSETLQKCYDAKSAALDRLYSNERR